MRGNALRIDALAAEIGSTTTVVSAFDGLDTSPRFLGQGLAPTTVLEGDVTRGLEAAIADLERSLAFEPGGLQWRLMVASSSAAGGLRMTVHGLVYDMTVKAAREAALGAGAILRHVTAGELTEADLEEIRRIRPNIILLAGGVDYGEKDTVIANARRLAASGINAPIIYAGNVAARKEIQAILADGGRRLYIVDNVYPRIDELNIEPARCAIQDAFEQHITGAPGMEKIRRLVDGPITPTPGAVMNAARLLYGEIGDLMVVDVGGATTDVHSVTEGSDEVTRVLVYPEPVAKRTVEGDLGMFVNAANVANLVGWEAIEARLGPAARQVLAGLHPIPSGPAEVALVRLLTATAVEIAVRRHAGRLRHLYGPAGRTTVAEGKDLSRVRWIIGTGGALTRLPGGEETLAALTGPGPGRELFPGPEARVLLDREYIMAPLGTLSARFPEAAAFLLRASLGTLGGRETDATSIYSGPPYRDQP